MKWERKNNWGSIYYECNGKTLQRDVEEALATFPDGIERVCRLRWDNHEEEVWDHGNSYRARSKVPMVCVTVGGLEFAASIEQFESVVPLSPRLHTSRFSQSNGGDS